MSQSLQKTWDDLTSEQRNHLRDYDEKCSRCGRFVVFTLCGIGAECGCVHLLLSNLHEPSYHEVDEIEDHQKKADAAVPAGPCPSCGTSPPIRCAPECDNPRPFPKAKGGRVV